MKISIITVSFNAADTIEETISSVLNQSYDTIEYIVIDGASSDNTLNIIHKYEDRIHHLISEKDEGIYDAMNKGVRLASGDYIGILNADDVYAGSDVIEDIVEYLNEHKADALYGDLVYVKKDNLERVIRNWKSKKYKRENFLNGWMPPHPTFFLKREHYLKFGLYKTNFRISADYELMLRMLYKEHLHAVYLPKLITRMRVGGESNANLLQRFRANMEDRKAWKINDIMPNALTLIKKPLGKLTQFVSN